MPALTSTGTELRRFRRGRLPRLAVAAMILVPLLYGALYLWAFWDPTGNLDRLPVALVNADQGAVLDGTPLHAGDEVTDELTASADLDWRVTDAEDAAAGVADGTYYFAVTLPEDFSSDIASASGDAPTSARILVTYDDANSFLASTLGKSAMAQVEAAVSGSVGTQAVDRVLVGLGDARDGFAQAADGALTLRAAAGDLGDGAAQVADGAHRSADGARRLADGSATLDAGATTLAAGARDAADGATDLAAGADTLASAARSASDGAHRVDTGAAALASGLTSASSGATDLSTGTAQVAAGVTALHDELAPVLTAVPDLRTGLGQVAGYLTARAQAGDATAAQLASGLATQAGLLPSDDDVAALSGGLAALDAGATNAAAGAADLADGVAALSDGATTLADGADALTDGIGALATGAGTLADGTHTLATGTGSLAQGAARLTDGTGALSDGAATLADGTTTLAAGAQQVADGSGLLTDGVGTLADGLTSGTDAIPAGIATATRAETIASPVTLDESHVSEAEGFGEGFAPFFLPLALFVGALITWLLLRPLPTRALATPTSGWRIAFAGYLPALVLGVAQVAVMLGVVHVGLGLHLSSVVGTIGFTLLVAATFLALQQMLTAVLGPAAGKVAILALLMLQLASSGGTYPVETTPAFFRAIHPLLPMSYAVTGLRQVITGTLDARLWASVAVLAGVLVGSLAITAWRAGRLRTWSLERLHPALTI